MIMCVVYGTYTWDVVVGTDAFLQQAVPDLPGEDAGALPLVGGDLGDDLGGGDPRLAAADGSRPYRARLVVAAEYLGHAAVGHLEDARDVAGTRARVRQLDDLLAGRVRQRPPADEHAAQLVDAAVTWGTAPWGERGGPAGRPARRARAPTSWDGGQVGGRRAEPNRRDRPTAARGYTLERPLWDGSAFTHYVDA